MIATFRLLAWCLIPVATFCSVSLFAAEKDESAGNKGAAVNFRKPAVELNDSGAVIEQQDAQRKAQFETEDLQEKKQTLETEVRYAKAKLEASQKKMSVQSAAGNVDQVDRLNNEIKDWEARIKASKQQLAQIEADLAKTTAAGAALTGENDVLLPGENIELYVNEDASFNGKYEIRRGGYIILAQVGRIPIAGKTIEQAEAAVRRALEDSQLHHASVMLERISGSDVATGPLIYLSGEFKNPRPYRIPSGTAPTLVGVILSSGGVNEKADLSRVRVMRMAGGRGVVEIINVQKILDGTSTGGLTSDIVVGEGDVITVPAGPANLIYVTGNVKRQGSFRLVPGERLTAYGAILQAGGFARFADMKKVHVLRTMPDGTKRKIPDNVIEVQKGQRQDVILQTNDIVVVPEKWFSF
jgi:protein involved in polysaccharide export with SLBB domain